MTKIEDLPDILNLRQVAKYLTVSELTLKRWEKKGEIRFMRIGTRRDRRMRKVDLVAFINSKV